MALGKYQKLLDKLEILNLKYSNLEAKNSFNIFKILKKGSDEVNVHSNFICELLDPEGSHGKGAVFLDIFIKDIIGLNLSGVNSFYIVKTEHKNIDIYIERNEVVIIIENKIYAKDQNRQLERYYEYARTKNKKVYIVYLTLYGSEPSQRSLGNLSIDNIILLSYKYEIIKWTELCLKESVSSPTLRETIHQYLDLIKNLTGQSMSAEKRHEIINLLETGDNANYALQIQKNWIHAKWFAQKYFWEELVDRFTKEGFTQLIVDNLTYSNEHLDAYVHKVRNRKYYYGVFFKVNKIDDKHDICLFIEIGNDNELYYGLCIVEDGNKRLKRRGEEFSKEVKTMIDKGLAPSSDYWLTSVTHIDLRFYSFDNEKTVSLLNKDYRYKFIKKLYDEIHKFINFALNK